MTDIDTRRIEADVLSEAISVVAGAGSLDDVLSTIVRAATRLTSCERGALFLYDDSEGALVPRALIGADWDVYQRIRLRPGEGMSGAVYATGESQRVGIGSVSSWRSETHALFSRATLGESRGAGCAVPLRLNGRVIGTLAVGTSQRELTDFDISLLERLADQAGIAIERAQRVQELDQRNRELEQKNRLVTAVHRIALSTLVSLERDQIVEDLARSVVEAGMFRSLMVALVHEERGEVEVVRSHVREETGGAGGALTSRADWGTVVGTVYDLDDEDIVAQVARTGKLRDTSFTPGEVSYFIPVKSADRVLAVLATASTAAEKEDVLTRIEAMQPLLDQVAIAIEHSLLHEELRRLSGVGAWLAVWLHSIVTQPSTGSHDRCRIRSAASTSTRSLDTR